LYGVALFSTFIGCSSSLPGKYLHQAEHNVTLTSLVTHPEQYRGKVVILGGVIVEEKHDGDRLWLRMRNRPLDEDYRPHRPAELTGFEAGHYWVIMASENAPVNYRNWARATVVGEVSDVKPVGAHTDPVDEPVLAALYIRGWGGSTHSEPAWEESEDPNYRVRTPRGIHGEFGPQ
jgi:starvation-inducible outer membrane lipoprotein